MSAEKRFGAFKEGEKQITIVEKQKRDRGVNIQWLSLQGTLKF